MVVNYNMTDKTKASSYPNMYTIHKPELCFPGSTSPLSTPLPSLASQFKIPDPHPDYKTVLTTMRAQKASQMSKQCDSGSQDNEPNNTTNGVNSSTRSSPILSPSTQMVVGTEENPESGQRVGSEEAKKQRVSNQTKQIQDCSQSFNVKRNNCGLLAPQSLFEMSFARPARIFTTNRHTIISNKYATAADPRGYIPVFEYEVNNTTILIDQENSYILLTSICKALGPWRTDIVRQVESVPELESLCRRIRGGFLKIQGTWVPYKLAFELCKRVAHSIRMDLVPVFGFDFPEKCLSPIDVGFGELRILTNGRRGKKSTMATLAAMKNLPIRMQDQSSQSLTVSNTPITHSTDHSNLTRAGNQDSMIKTNTPLTNTTNQHANITAFSNNVNAAAPFTSRVVLRQHPYAIRSEMAFLAKRKMVTSQQYSTFGQRNHHQHHQHPVIHVSQPITSQTQ